MVQATGAPIAEYFAALDDPRIDRTGAGRGVDSSRQAPEKKEPRRPED